MSGPLTGKVALVAGVGQKARIGAAIARELASAGAKLFISHIRPYDQNQPWTVGDHEPEQILEDIRVGRAKAESLEVDLANAQSTP